MNILIAGSKGFIGSQLVNYFRNGNLVIGCDVRVAKQEENFHLIQSISDYEKILCENRFDLFINASGSPGVGFSIEHPEKDRELNTLNVEAMLSAIKKHSSKTRFINFSSAAVYGNPKRLPIMETDDVLPLSPYGMHKLEAENILKKYHSQFGLQTCSLRVFSAYGPGLFKQLFWDIFLKSKDTRSIQLFGTGKESRDFIFIDDLLKAVECIALNAEMRGGAINVSSGIETTISEAAQIFLEELGMPFDLNFSGERKEGDPVNWRADVTLLNEIGFHSRIPLKEGLKRLAKAYKGLPLPDEN